MWQSHFSDIRINAVAGDCQDDGKRGSRKRKGPGREGQSVGDKEDRACRDARDGECCEGLWHEQCVCEGCTCKSFEEVSLDVCFATRRSALQVQHCGRACAWLQRSG